MEKKTTKNQALSRNKVITISKLTEMNLSKFHIWKISTSTAERHR